MDETNKSVEIYLACIHQALQVAVCFNKGIKSTEKGKVSAASFRVWVIQQPLLLQRALTRTVFVIVPVLTLPVPVYTNHIIRHKDDEMREAR